MGSGKSKLALRRRAYGGQVGTLAATGVCTCRQGETLPKGREGEQERKGGRVCLWYVTVKAEFGAAGNGILKFWIITGFRVCSLTMETCACKHTGGYIEGQMFTHSTTLQT